MRGFPAIAVAFLGLSLQPAGAVAATPDAAPAAVSKAARGPVRAAFVVQDPWYGEGLYWFFQDRHFTALTRLLVSEHFERLPQQGEQVELLRAGLLLSYGMHREAGEAFARLIDRGAPPAVRDRAWYFLARIRFQRGLPEQARDAIARIQAPLLPDLEPDRLLLEANLLMARGDYSKAASLLKDLPGDTITALYVRYNLGVALVRDGQMLRGNELLERVGRAQGSTEEIRSLRDKANVALGFAALRDKLPERAMLYLERVRMEGMLANHALLGFGWAELALERPERALVAWNELAARGGSDAAVLEANLAIPYATARLGGNAQALEAYERALALFESERGHIDRAIATVRAGDVLQGLLARNLREEAGWRGGIEDVSGVPGAGYLIDALASHEFQEAFKNWRDLQSLAGNLAQWDAALPGYDDMLASRARAYAERIAGPAGEERRAAIQQFSARRDGLRRELDSALAEGDGMALADSREKRLARRLGEVEAGLSAMGEGAEADALRERARRARGALVWQAAQQAAPRRRVVESGLRALDGELARSRAVQAALLRARDEEPGRIGRFAERSRELAARVRDLQEKTRLLTAEQERQLGDLAVAALEMEKEWLAGYATQARFAMAQIYDRAGAGPGAGPGRGPAQEATHEPRP